MAGGRQSRRPGSVRIRCGPSAAAKAQVHGPLEGETIDNEAIKSKTVKSETVEGKTDDKQRRDRPRLHTSGRGEAQLSNDQPAALLAAAAAPGVTDTEKTTRASIRPSLACSEAAVAGDDDRLYAGL